VTEVILYFGRGPQAAGKLKRTENSQRERARGNPSLSGKRTTGGDEGRGGSP